MNRTPARADSKVLDYYARTYGDQVCTGCNACEPHCPHGLTVANILRWSMYTNDYHLPEMGRPAYARIGGANASACIDCAAPCQGHCEPRVAIKREMIKAHRALRIADDDTFA